MKNTAQCVIVLSEERKYESEYEIVNGETPKTSNRNKLLNIIEAIAAFFVVLIHFPLPGIVGTLVTAIARFSVPFFFSVSGYFFYKNDDSLELKSIGRKIKRLLKLVLISELGYFTYYLAMQIRQVGFSFQAPKNLIESEFFNYYLKNIWERVPVLSPVFNGTAWFITSLAAIYALMYIVIKFDLKRFLIKVSPFLLISGLILRLTFVCLGIRTVIIYGNLIPFLPLPFFVMGYCINMYKFKFDKIRNYIYLLLLFVGVISALLESFLTGAHVLYFGTCIIVFSLFCIAVKNDKYQPQSFCNKLLSFIGEKHGTFVYIMHLMIAGFISFAFRTVLFEFSQSIVYEWVFPFLVIIFTTLVSVIIKYIVSSIKKLMN